MPLLQKQKNMRTGQCFLFHFSEDANDFKGYFFTGLIDDGKYVMCEMLPPHRINPLTSYMRISEADWTEGLSNGKIELI